MVHKDLKIGLVLGLILVILALVKLATDPRLSPKARMLHIQNAAARQKSNNPQEKDFTEFPENENMPEKPSYIEIQKNVPDTGDSKPADLPPNEPAPIESNATNTQDRQTTTDTEQSEPTDVSRYLEAEKIKTQRFHIVRKNETLSAISREYYGSANKWRKIFEANRDIIKDPNKINSGIKLIIPD